MEASFTGGGVFFRCGDVHDGSQVAFAHDADESVFDGISFAYEVNVVSAFVTPCSEFVADGGQRCRRCYRGSQVVFLGFAFVDKQLRLLGEL